MTKSPTSPPSQQVQGAAQPVFREVWIHQRGRLPHWEKEGGIYFLTFHLADSLPQQVLDKITERHRILLASKRTGASLSPSQKALVSDYSPAKIEAYFDRGMGECVLRDPRLAQAMADALQFWEGRKYRLLAWCIMPNHVHVVCCMLPGHGIGDVVKSWKMHVSFAARQSFARTGALWQREYFDRLIRKEGELDRAVNYVLFNPERAGLASWPWVWSAGVDARTTAGLETGAPS